MTTPVTDLACMDGANMAAIALQLKHTARQAEQRIYTLEQKLRASLNRPTKVQRSTANITGIVSEPIIGYQMIGPSAGGSFVTDFDNTGLDANIDSSSRTMFGVLGAGLYEFGIAANLIASGAVNNNSYRIFRIIQTRLDPTVADEVEVDESAITMYESNTGVRVDCTVVATFRMQAADRIRFAVQHNNISSTLNSAANATVWMTKLSTNDAVVVT